MAAAAATVRQTEISPICTTASGVPLVAGETFSLGLAAVTPLRSGYLVPGSQVV